jgi:ABC-type amino acid transport substrate-binding protein
MLKMVYACAQYILVCCIECHERRDLSPAKGPIVVSHEKSFASPKTHFLEENMKKLFPVASLIAVAALILSACGGGGPTADNLLDDIKQRGYILVSTDVDYEPQSFLNTAGKRPADSKCPTDALTSAEVQGFDIDVARAIGDGLGVETCFATPSWDAITAGNWANKWDVSVG